MKKYLLIVFALFLLSACAATPKINLVRSMGITMELNKPADMPSSVTISPNAKYGLSSAWKRTMRLWDLSEGKLIHRLTGHEGRVQKAAFSPDSQHIISGGFDKAIRLWDTSSGREIRQFVGHQGSFPYGVMVTDVAFSPDGSKVLSVGASDKTVKMWDFKTGNEIRTFADPQVFSTEHAVFSPDGKYILSSVYYNNLFGRIKAGDQRGG
jgi:WD40 repeat protein